MARFHFKDAPVVASKVSRLYGTLRVRIDAYFVRQIALGNFVKPNKHPRFWVRLYALGTRQNCRKRLTAVNDAKAPQR